MDKHAFGLRLQTNAPEGRTQFPNQISTNVLSVLQQTLRWLTLLTVLPLLVARPALAITRHDGKPPLFKESFVSELPKDQQPTWKWVASGERGTIPFSGILISDCYILTCAHAFFENASEGTGKLTADPKTISFSFPDPADPFKWEGRPAGGDSGGPMFIMRDKEPIVVGVTSSCSNSLSDYGTVAYDTRVQSYSKWIKDTIDKNPCPVKKPEPMPQAGNDAIHFVITKLPIISQSGVSTALRVERGAGSGSYTPGTIVTVTADPAPAGQHFAGWTGDIVILANPSLATTAAIIPSMDVSVIATYRTNAQSQRSLGEESLGISSLREDRADRVPVSLYHQQ